MSVLLTQDVVIKKNSSQKLECILLMESKSMLEKIS